MSVDPVASAIAEEQESAILVEGLDHGVQFANRRWHELVDTDGVGFPSLISRLQPAEALRAHEKFAQSAVTREPIHFQSRMTTPEARPWVQIARYPVVDADGAVTAWVTSVSDRVVRTDSVTAVAPQDDVLAGVERLLQVGAWDWKIDDDVVWWSAEASRILGHSAGQHTGHFADLLAWVHPDDRTEVLAYRQLALDSEQPFDMRFRAVRPDRTVLVVQARAEVVRDDVGEPVRMLGTLEDISTEFAEGTAAAHTARALATLRRGNRVLPNANDTHVLVREICAAAVDAGQYHLAWYGELDPEHPDGVRLVDVAGPASPYVDRLVLTWADQPQASGPISRALLAGEAVVIVDARTDPGFTPWRDLAAEFGLRSMIAIPIRVDGGISGILAVYAKEPGCFDGPAQELLEELGAELGLGLERIGASARTTQALEGTIRVLAATVEIRDPYTAGHQSAVADLARRIGSVMGLDDTTLQGVHLAGLVHDIGKVSVPAEILTRPGHLRPAELALIQEHPLIGETLLGTIEFPWPIARMVGEHHERWDGSGYPRGLVGVETLLGSRILAVADVVEAMTRRRPYRASLGEERAREEISGGRGILFDPEVVDACLAVLDAGFDFEADGS